MWKVRELVDKAWVCPGFCFLKSLCVDAEARYLWRCGSRDVTSSADHEHHTINITVWSLLFHDFKPIYDPFPTMRVLPLNLHNFHAFFKFIFLWAVFQTPVSCLSRQHLWAWQERATFWGIIGPFYLHIMLSKCWLCRQPTTFSRYILLICTFFLPSVIPLKHLFSQQQMSLNGLEWYFSPCYIFFICV